MREIKSFLLLLIGMTVMNVYAADTTNGYLMSTYGNAVKSAYGNCVHSAYYDPETDQREECGDVKEVASAPVEQPKVVVETVTISDADNVLFNFDQATLTAAGISAINEFGKKLGAQPDITKITIDGYTDAIGKPDYNLKLSSERAEAVKQFFIQNGMQAAIITTHGYGEQDAKVSVDCIAKNGNVDVAQISQLEDELKSKKYKSKNPTVVRQKNKLNEKIQVLKAKRSDLIACTAPDRRVVFTIEHNKKVEKTVMDKVNASDAVDVRKLPQPPADAQ